MHSMRGVRLLLTVLAITFSTTMIPLTQAQELLDGQTQPKFINPVPNALDPSFIFTEASPNHYEIGMFQTQQWLGLVDPMTGDPLMTTVWGYGNKANPAQGPTFPGRTFVVHRDQQITVQWSNDLVDGGGAPLPHLLPVDRSLHWAFSLPGFSPGDLETYGVPVVPHVHGGHTESDSDGLPEYWWTPGETAVGPRFVKSLYVYDNDQPAGTIWYHDHGLGITRLNVYAGLAGFFIIRDDVDTGMPDNPLGLPAGPYEIPLVIQDRLFTTDGQLFYPTVPEEVEPDYPPVPEISALPEFFGDHILVNGATWPFLNVEPRKYRLRFLNGSDSRFYDLLIGEDMPFHVIGTDDALLAAPVVADQFVIGPGERYDVVVDFAGFEGQSLVLRNVARSPYPKGDVVDPMTTGRIMLFHVGTEVTVPDQPLPGTLGPPIVPDAMLADLDNVRSLALFEGIDQFGRLQPMLGLAKPATDIEGDTVNGAMLWDENHYPITEFPMLDDVEVWEVYNATADAHPIHLHLVSFQILGRQKFKADLVEKELTAHDGSTSIGFELDSIRMIGQPKMPLAHEQGWKDTAIMYPGEITRVIARFDRPGRYVWHCHILSHEDHEMMRPYEVLEPDMAKQAGSEQSPAGRSTRSVTLAASPSPFNPATTIEYTLPKAANVSLGVYNVRGELVRVLVREPQAAGSHSVPWNGTDLNGASVASGAYIVHLRAGAESATEKILLTK
jgi:spore coat protein A